MLERSSRCLTAALAISLLAAPAMAEPVEETYGHATPEEACAAFNREQAEFAKRQLAENAASKRAYEEALMARQAQMRQQRNAYELEKQRRAREYDEALEHWRADVAACNAGHKSHCAKD